MFELVPATPTLFDPVFLHIKNNGTSLPRFSSRDITVTEKLFGMGYMAKVCVQGADLCSKIAQRDTSTAVQREYECLLQFHGVSIPIRTPKLLGLVVDDDEVTIGILEGFVDNVETLVTLGRIPGGMAGIDRSGERNGLVRSKNL